MCESSKKKRAECKVMNYVKALFRKTIKIIMKFIPFELKIIKHKEILLI